MPTCLKTYFLTIVFSLVVFIFTASSCKIKQTPLKSKMTVSGVVTQISSYCGGARPTDEMLEELQMPRVYPNKKFHVIKGDTNLPKHEIILTFFSDDKGSFSFELEPGIYSLIVDEQAEELNVKKYISTDLAMEEDCFKHWWAKPYYVLNISDKPINNLNFNFKKRCFIPYDIPCLMYEGPMPP